MTGGDSEGKKMWMKEKGQSEGAGCEVRKKLIRR